MSDDNLNNSSMIQTSTNQEDKVQSVKNLIQNLKQQLEQEKLMRKEEQQLLLEARARSSDADLKIIQLQELLQRQSSEKDQLEYKNETLIKKIEELQLQTKDKKKNGGLFDSIFSGKQTKIMEQVQQQLQQNQEELQIKTEETERLHEHLYELKRELNTKIETLNNSMEQYKSLNDQQVQLIKSHEQKEVDYKKSIDGLHNAKKIVEKELENSIKELSNIKVQYSSDTISLNRVVSIQKELLDIKIPSFKKQTQNYDTLIQEDKKIQQQTTYKEKEREVFKMFNAQRECMKKQFSNIFTIFEQKINTFVSNIDSSLNNGNSSVFIKYKEVAQSCIQKLVELKEGINGIFNCKDKLISLQYQISSAKQQSQTIEQIELLEQQDNEKILLIEKLEDTKNLTSQFLSELKLYFNEELDLINNPPSSLQKTYTDLIDSIKDLEDIFDYYLQTFQAQIVFNVQDAQQFTYLRDNYKNKLNAREEFLQISTKFFNKLNQFFIQLKKKSILENEIIEQIVSQQKEQKELKSEEDQCYNNRLSISFKFILISPNSLSNQNLTLITSLDAFKASVIELSEIYFHFLNDFNLKEPFILEQFKQLDLIRVVDEYLNKINKSVDIHCILSNQTQIKRNISLFKIKEMSGKITEQTEQIKSLNIAIDGQNEKVNELIETKIKTEEQLSIKIKIMEELKDQFTKQIKTENGNNICFDNILNLMDNEKGNLVLQKLQRQTELSQSKQRVQDKVNQEKFLKEVTTNLTPIEKILSDQKLNNENEKKVITVFEKSREKLISLIFQNNQFEKRSKETTIRLEEKENKIKKYQTEINDQKQQIDKLKSNNISQQNDNNNTTSATNNLIDTF